MMMMHYGAKCGIAIACRLSVCLSVCLSVTLVDCDHIGWEHSIKSYTGNTSKLEKIHPVYLSNKT